MVILITLYSSLSVRFRRKGLMTKVSDLDTFIVLKHHRPEQEHAYRQCPKTHTASVKKVFEEGSLYDAFIWAETLTGKKGEFVGDSQKMAALLSRAGRAAKFLKQGLWEAFSEEDHSVFSSLSRDHRSVHLGALIAEQFTLSELSKRFQLEFEPGRLKIGVGVSFRLGGGVSDLKIQPAGRSNSPWEGETCRIRDFRRSDATCFHAFASNPAVSQFMSWEPHASIDVTRRYLDGVCRKKGGVETPRAIAHKDSDMCCGFVSFTNYEAEHRRADLAIALCPSAQGRGMAQDACRCLLARAKTMGLVRLQAIVEEGNEASRNLMQRLGATEEGVLKYYLHAKNGLVDAYMYAFYFAGDRPSALPVTKP